ncbi:MAG TPA: heavy-metal-associated domain-containing protein [Bacteroidia bacterium]|nr:heavy-metal-associated domain-containing protein [Bacteroidia bacterium]
MKALSLIALAASLLLSPALRADEAAAYQVKVPSMVCAGCAYTIGEELKKLDHVTEVYVDPKTKVALVAVDNAEGPGETAVLDAVKAAGYEGKGYAKLAKPFAEAKAALTARKS